MRRGFLTLAEPASSIARPNNHREFRCQPSISRAFEGCGMKLKSAGNAPWIFAAIILIAASLLFQASRLRAEGGEPRYFAITNARIVPVSGPVLESGTVVIANGLIQSVGASASAKIPAGSLGD